MEETVCCAVSTLCGRKLNLSLNDLFTLYFFLNNRPKNSLHFNKYDAKMHLLHFSSFLCFLECKGLFR